MDKNRLVLTGGHAATTAVAVIEEIKFKKKDWKIFWIGVKNAIEGKKITTLESEVLPRLGVKFLSITTGRLQRKFTFWSIPSLFKIPLGFVQSFYYLIKIKPCVVLSFGGFASFPVVFSAKMLGVPVIIHEQTSAAGRANLLSARFATKITLAREESKKYFNNLRCLAIGNPLMKEVKKVKPVVKLKEIPVIYITGGSRGSQIINSTVEKILKKLLAKYKVIHQTGGIDYLRFSEIKQKLPEALRKNYEVYMRINPLKISDIYSRSDILISRSGANTVSEIMSVKRPSILIPLPISYLNEQFKNAEIARKWGIAKVISQDKLTPDRLLFYIERLISDFSIIVKNIHNKKSPDYYASEKIVALLEDYLK